MNSSLVTLSCIISLVTGRSTAARRRYRRRLLPRTSRAIFILITADQHSWGGAKLMSDISPYMYRKVKVRNFPSGGDFLETIFVIAPREPEFSRANPDRLVGRVPRPGVRARRRCLR